MQNQFENQIGFAMCSNGWIDKVRVKSEPDLDARNCGIGTVFTTLCMIDPELHMLPWSLNASVNWIKQRRIIMNS